MLHKLREGDYSRVLPLLTEQEPNYFDLIARSVIAGNAPGDIWADDAVQPRSVLVRDNGYCYYLIGDAGNIDFNDALQALVSEEVAPSSLQRGREFFKLYWASLDWKGKVENIFSTAVLQERERTIFALNCPLLPDWRHRLPTGTSILPIDAHLLQGGHVNNLEPVVHEVTAMWGTVDNFLDKGFGYCLLAGHEVACWCTAEYIAGSDTGVGIETEQRFWNRGFATLTAAAFVEHCVTHGLTPHWVAWKSNAPSHKVAENVGFKKVRDFSIVLGRFVNGD
jgi:GNAT superfamily N-acetyltransferase